MKINNYRRINNKIFDTLSRNKLHDTVAAVFNAAAAMRIDLLC